ncbi:MAG: menaquinone biosynthesis protein [Verrucomicrobiales bacterium]|nr:menaquinone biosynthesis protein [Verrucomicrobiales bacterium]
MSRLPGFVEWGGPGYGADMRRASGLAGRYRIGSVPYLNALPLTRDLGHPVVLLPPAALAVELHAGHLDAALVSVTEPLLHPGYRIVDGAGIVSHGPVASVFLAHRGPLEGIQTVHVDPATRTSIELLRILLAERGCRPGFRPLDRYADASSLDAVLLIGNPALEFRRSGATHELWDLGGAWAQFTGLPFVYATWVVRDGPEAVPLARSLRAAAETGIAAIPTLVDSRPEFDRALREAYLGGHIRYLIGPVEKSGVLRFAELLAKHGGQRVFPPHFV